MHNALLAVPEFAIVLVHVVVLGGWLVRAVGYAPADRWTWFAVVPAIGFAAFGAELFVLGEARLLTRPTLYASCGCMAVLFAWRRPLAGFPRPAPAGAEPPGRRRVLVAVVALTVAVVIGGCFYPPRREDELQYHWPTPLLWAAHHGWVASPYRLSNGPALAEMFYTVGALFGNPTAAHFTAAGFVVVIAAACGALARAVGGPPWAAAAAAVSIPTFVADAPNAMNDNIVAAFALAAYVPLLCGAGLTPPASAVALTAILTAAAVSTKPFAVLAAAGLVAYLLARAVRPGPARRRMAASAVAVGLAVAVTLGVWAVHCRVRTGQWWDTQGYVMAASPADPMWDSAVAAGRLPRLVDRFTTPVLLPLQGSVGKEVGWRGNRIGPLVVVFALLAIPGTRRLGGQGRAKLAWLVGSALFFLVVFSPFSPKTRFHLFVWFSFAVASSVGLQWTLRPPRRRLAANLAFAAFVAMALFGPADASRRIFHFDQGLRRRLAP